MGQATLQGMFAVKLPVSDLTRSRAWYEQVFGFVPEIEFPDDDGVGAASPVICPASPTLPLRCGRTRRLPAAWPASTC